MKHASIVCGMMFWLLTGCNTVSVIEPIGSPVQAAELKELEGGWVNEDGEVVEVRLAKSGKLLIGGVEWDEDSEQFRAESIDVVATKCGDLKLFHLKSDDDSPNERYAFCRYEIEGDRVSVYPAVVAVFQEAVTSKELAGSIGVQPFCTTVRLDSTGKTLESFIAEMSKNTCFEREPGATFERLKRVD